MQAAHTGSLLGRADTILGRGLCCETDISLRSRTWRDRLFGYDIFVSYSARDNLWATNLEALLKFGRFRVFRDHSQLNTGDHLDRLLKEVRRSTMLLLLVSDDSMASDWVHRELQAYLERPRKEWRIAPVFLDTRYPRDLPPRFRVLGDFHGVELPMAPENAADIESDGKLLLDLTSNFRATQRALRAIRRTSFCNAGHGRNTMSARRLGQWRDRESAEVDQGSHSLRMQGARFDGSLQGDTTLVEFKTNYETTT